MKSEQKRKTSRYDIFFCHPSQDRRKASLIVSFLKRIIHEALNNKYKIFYSPEDLKKDRKSKAWRDGINRALRNSKCMIVYYTPNALKSKWMNYEIGAMASHSKTLIPITTGDVDLSQVLINDGTAVNIASGGSETLEDWVNRIITELNPKTKNIIDNESITDESVDNPEKQDIKKWFSDTNNKVVIDKFIEDIRTQTIYIIGSKPRKFDSEWNNGLVSELSRGLLEREFILASSPSVKEVGFIVAKECLKTPSKYTIAGLHRFESDLIKKSGVSDGSIRDSIKDFRKRYLKGIDAVIVIGGKQNTLSEIEVAKEEGKQFFFIPCMGGIGANEYAERFTQNEIPKEYPCFNCENGLFCTKMEALCDYIANKLHELK